MRKCISLDDKLRQMEQEISVNPQYVQKVRVQENKEEKRKKRKRGWMGQ